MSNVRVISVSRSDEPGTMKTPVEEVMLDSSGVVGDAQTGEEIGQVSLLARESIDRFAAETHRKFAPGEFAENLTIEGVDLRSASVLDRFRFGDVELEVTRIGRECHDDNCAILQQVGRCIMPTEGVLCRVVAGGVIRPDDSGQYVPKTLRMHVITISDRAAGGQYADRTGPLIRRILEKFFDDKRWRVEIDHSLLPDNSDRLWAELVTARDHRTDVVITTGGTGVGPTDITPEVVTGFCDKVIPGIMEYIRCRHARKNADAMLSRSVAALSGTMQVYAIPGSVRAVREYMGEILRVLEHVLCMVHGLDVH